ncbi:centromere/kinetochore protein zw10 [Drosophila eugracilis]|uniref:centromere/kinetochore protein zw10 n=1 Tax=Drosophila eugracilis TaxID=29029 RepID=UPI0007E5E6A4|nr:centromere/kinetochore protein zw10 [Drosophila eugracilis]
MEEVAPHFKVLEEVFHGNGNGCASVDATQSAILKVLTRVNRFQVRVRKHIDDNYTEFMPNHTSPDIFLEESASLNREIHDLLETVGAEGLGALNEANAKLADSGRQLREILLGLGVSEHVLKIDELFQCVEEAKAIKDYLVILDLVGRLRAFIYDDDAGEENASQVATPEIRRVFQALDCYETIKVKYHVQAHLLQQSLQERFDRLVQLQCKSFPTSRCVTLQVSRDQAQLQDIVQALFQEPYNPVRLCEFLLDNCIEPLTLRPVMAEYNEDADGGTYIRLSLSYATKEPSSAQLRPNYKQVLENFRLLLQTLAGINCSVSSEQHVFSIIGDHVKDKMLQLLVDECLIPAVPETMEEYQSSTLCEDVTQFEQLLADSFIINPDHDRALGQFVEQYETYYRNRLFSRVLDTAREIIQRDLQDMVLIAPNNLTTEVANDPFLFPRCMVSKSAQDFVKLMDRILRQPTEKMGEDQTDPLAGVIAIMLHTYIDEVPKVHRKLLDSIPQQAVLFHNNCMYLTHWVAQHANKGIESLAALAKTLQATGQQHFRVQVNYQSSILMEIMQGFEFESPHTMGSGPLKLVRQCLRQLELLKNVWANVLPETVYNVTFCELINTFVAELIRRVFTLRDISATMACELSDLIDVVLQRAPTLFREPNEVVKVLSWLKLQQLKTMMNASLKEITELWCDGAGPLTATYKSDEVRHLIRALFQDTDRRAKAITQIV